MTRAVLAAVGIGALATACSRGDDGRRTLIAFAMQRELNQEIMVIAPDGSGVRTIASSPEYDETPAWAPDGFGLLFASGRGDLKSGVYLFDGKLSLLFGAHTWIERAPAWAPSGRSIAFMSNRDGNWEIYTVGSDGNNPVRLTETDAFEQWPAWSADSAKIAFVSNEGGQHDVYVMAAEGSDPMQLTNDRGWDGPPAWSPDGARIAWPSEREGQLAYYVMKPDGTEAVRVTSFEPRSDDPFFPAASWSPDGERLVFVSSRDGFRELYLVDADGSNERRLTTLRGTITNPAWSPRLPPDLSWMDR